MTLPHTVVEHSIPLPVIEDELRMPAQLVAMQAGYLDHYDQSQPDRKQVSSKTQTFSCSNLFNTAN